MIDFKEYEESVEKYAKSNKHKQMPLMSWDFYSEAFTKISISLMDANKISQLSFHNNWNLKLNLKDELLDNTVVVVTDVKLKIVFASHNITLMNGYKPEEIIGQSPKMFQGKDTCPITSMEIRNAIEERKPFDKMVVNYCKDGSIYKCQIKGYPVFDNKGILQNFIALEKIAS